ncbi:hypothetical protein LIER_38223 [Lithospermum erythrorhizon]|uniref:Uncharacterized protein n=1 Tax=Lithospermum erythrorhizon TaxID=34254 RepID=A0AAV3PXB5_LITER
MSRLVDDDVSTWFLSEMRFDWRECWPRWKNVNTTVQDRLWNNFKNYFDIEVEESTVKHLFLKQVSLWYWRSMGTINKEALEAEKMEDNRKKNASGDDEVHNKNFHSAWGKYVLLFKDRYGQDLDPKNYPPDLHIWDALEEVKDGRKKG